MESNYIVLRSRRAPTRGVRAPMVAAALGAGETSPPPLTSMKVDIVDARAAANAVEDPDFEAAAPSMPMKLIGPVAEAVAPTAAGAAWGVTAVGADTSPFDGTGVVVAVLDTGIDATHPAFNGITLVEKDFTGEGNGDRIGHGTHCAGTIFGRDVGGTRIGVARGVTKALIGKVLGGAGGGSESIVSAIQWAIDEGAHVISMSLGIDFPGFQKRLEAGGMKQEAATSLALEGYRLNIQLFDRLAAMVSALGSFRQPCLLVAAAGNESGRDEQPPFSIAASPPAVSDGFVAVAALQQGARALGVASFSNTGAALSAPGVGIVSAKAGGGLVAFDGTSMATPHVAGVAALWAQKLKAEGTFTARQFAARVLASADLGTIDPSLSPDDVGAGIVQAPQR